MYETDMLERIENAINGQTKLRKMVRHALEDCVSTLDLYAKKLRMDGHYYRDPNNDDVRCEIEDRWNLLSAVQDKQLYSPDHEIDYRAMYEARKCVGDALLCLLIKQNQPLDEYNNQYMQALFPDYVEEDE